MSFSDVVGSPQLFVFCRSAADGDKEALQVLQGL